MNQGQQMFYNFILEHCKEENVEEAKAMLTDAFQKQQENTFDTAELEKFMLRMLELVKDDSKETVMGAMQHFKQNR